MSLSQVAKGHLPIAPSTSSVLARDIQGDLSNCPLYRLGYSRSRKITSLVLQVYQGEVSSSPEFEANKGRLKIPPSISVN